VWTSFAVNAEGVSVGCRVHLTITDETGAVIWNAFYYPQNLTVDDDSVPLSSVYLVEVDLVNADGNTVDSRSALVATPKPKAKTT